MPRALLAAATAASLLFAGPALAETIHPDAPDPLAGAGSQLPDMSNFAWRHGQLGLHQGFGLATLGAMALTAGVGYYQAEINGSSDLRDTHLLLGGATSALYLTTATLALTAPPRPLVLQESGWDSISLHRNLAWLHAAGMLATVGLGLLTNYNSASFTPYHKYAALSTVGLMAVSAGVIVFGE